MVTAAAGRLHWLARACTRAWRGEGQRSAPCRASPRPYAYEVHSLLTELKGPEKVVGALVAARKFTQETTKTLAEFWTTARPHPAPLSFPGPVAGRAMMFP